MDYTHPPDILRKAPVYESSHTPVLEVITGGRKEIPFSDEWRVLLVVRQKQEQRIQRGHLRPQRTSCRVTKPPADLRKAEEVLLVLVARYGDLVDNKLDYVEDEEGARSNHGAGRRIVLGMVVVRDQEVLGERALPMLATSRVSEFEELLRLIRMTSTPSLGQDPLCHLPPLH